MRAHASVHDLRNCELGERVACVDLGVDGGQEWEWSCLAASSWLVLDVVDDQAVRLEHAKSGYLLGRNLMQPLGVCRQLRRRDSIETNPGESTVQFFEKSSQRVPRIIEIALSVQRGAKGRVAGASQRPKGANLSAGLENWLTTHLGFHGISDKTLFMSFVVHLTDLLLRW